MTLDIILLILFIILIIFILFREEFFSLFESKSKFKREERGNKKPERSSQEQRPTPKQKSTKTEEAKKEYREKEQREAKARTAALQKTAEKRAATERIGKEKAAKEKADAKKILAKQRADEKAAREEEAKKAAVSTKELPKGEYPDFSNSRLLDMGLSQADADTFVKDLIEQIDDHIPQIEAARKDKAYEEIERLTHSLKGSATNLGSGGVADTLVDYNTYCKTGNDDDILLAYLEILKTYQTKLKEQFS